MILGIVEKIVFGVLLLASLQIPVLAVQYKQFLNGYFEATAFQVRGYEATAIQFEYPSVEAMIEHHLQNSVASVRADALQKRDTLVLYHNLREATHLFDDGSLLDQAFYMVSETGRPMLEKTLENFQPGLPLELKPAGYCAVMALLLSLLIFEPFKWMLRRRSAR